MAKSRKKATEDVVNRTPAEAPAEGKRAARAASPAKPKAAAAPRRKGASDTPAAEPLSAPVQEIAGIEAAPAVEPVPAERTPAATAEPAWPGPAVEPIGAAGNGVPSDRIASRAYEIYQSRGGVHGDPLQDWLQAERELKGQPEHSR
jgi:hypothetical protein